MIKICDMLAQSGLFYIHFLTASKCSRCLVYKLHPVSPIYTASQSRHGILYTSPLISDSTIRTLGLQKTDDNIQCGFKATAMPTLWFWPKFCKQEMRYCSDDATRTEERNVNLNKNTSENAALNKIFHSDERAPSVISKNLFVLMLKPSNDRHGKTEEFN